MSGKMENKIKEVLEYAGYSPVIRAIYRLARHIDEVEKQKEDNEFTSEADKEADLPAKTTCKMAGQEHPIIVPGTGGKLPDKPQSIPTSMSQLKAESQDQTKLEQLWEQERDTFIQVTESEFNALFHKKEFAEDPLSSKPSKWTFGILTNGHRRCFRINQAESQDTPPTPEPDLSPDKEIDLPAKKEEQPYYYRSDSPRNRKMDQS